MQHSLHISCRRVKQEHGVRAFQRDAFDAIFNSTSRLVIVEAPVGAGKSYIIRQLTERIHDQPVVLTFPTKMLQEAQCKAIREQESEQKKPVAIWPDDRDRWPVTDEDGLNIWKYSSDSLLNFLSDAPDQFEEFRNRGQLLGHGLFTLRYSNRQIFVTTPDVLWLIYSPFSGYRRSAKQMLQAQLAKSVVCLDEFHCYANLANFYGLLKQILLEGKVGKVIMLSATPFLRLDQWSEFDDELKRRRIGVDRVGFDESDDGHVFNYPVDLTIHRFAYRRKALLRVKLDSILMDLPKPAAIIFNSLFRLAHMKPLIEIMARNRFIVREYSGRSKNDDVTTLIAAGEPVVLLGTSAIEVGIDMKFRAAVIEAGAWPNAIQRLGRVGRAQFSADPSPEANIATVHLFIDSRDTWNALSQNQVLGRSELEQLLMENLRDPTEALTTGEMFRGESFNFVLFDRFVGRPIVYAEALFSIYDIDERHVASFKGTPADKENTLRKAGIVDKNDVRRIMLYDQLYPIWGTINCDGLRDDYDAVTNIEKIPEKNPIRIQIQTESGQCFNFARSRPDSNIKTELPF